MNSVGSRKRIKSKWFAFIVGSVAGIIVYFYTTLLETDHIGLSILSDSPVTLWHLISNSDHSSSAILVSHLLFYGLVGLLFHKLTQKIKRRKTLFCILFLAMLLVIGYMFAWIDAFLLAMRLEEAFKHL